VPFCPPQITHGMTREETKLIIAEIENTLRGPYYIIFIAQTALSKVLINVTELI
jgi:hypothetical protein